MPKDLPSPSRKPKAITKTSWWYEDRRGIDVIHQIHASGAYVRTDSMRIYWAKLIAAAKRCGKI